MSGAGPRFSASHTYSPLWPATTGDGSTHSESAFIMDETTKVPATEVLYSSMDRTVTIRFKEAIAVTLPLPDAMTLGWQLVDLLKPE
jgi:hypothetical protein